MYPMCYRVMRTSAPIVGALSGGFIYFIMNDFYIVAMKRGKYTSLNNVSQIMNIGFFAGFGIGVSYAITGKPLMDNLLH